MAEPTLLLLLAWLAFVVALATGPGFRRLVVAVARLALSLAVAVWLVLALAALPAVCVASLVWLWRNL